MRGRLTALGPIALLTGGCVERAYTPSELVPSAQPEPETRAIQVPARDEVVSRWQLPTASPWAPYVKYTLLSALDATPRAGELPDVSALEVVRQARTAGDAVASAGMPRDTAWIVDLRGAASVAFGWAVTHGARESVAAVPTFNNWPADEELVPAEETLAAMVWWPPRLPAADDRSARPLFLLDAWRLAFKEEEIEEGTTDNRYMLSPADFPSADDLRANGITRVVYLVEDADQVKREEDDLHALFLAYQQQGIRIVMVDLPFFARRAAYEEPWPVAIDSRVVIIEPRVTVVDDPGFYVRAHGGFGGVHGAPYVPHGHGGGWGHFGGWGHVGHGGG